MSGRISCRFLFSFSCCFAVCQCLAAGYQTINVSFSALSLSLCCWEGKNVWHKCLLATLYRFFAINFMFGSGSFGWCSTKVGKTMNMFRYANSEKSKPSSRCVQRCTHFCCSLEWYIVVVFCCLYCCCCLYWVWGGNEKASKWKLVSKSLIFVTSGAISLYPRTHEWACGWMGGLVGVGIIWWRWQKTITKEKFMYIFHLNGNSTVLNSLKPPFIVICYYAYLHFLSSAIFYRSSIRSRHFLLLSERIFSFVRSCHFEYQHWWMPESEWERVRGMMCLCAWVSILIECVFKASKSHKYKKTIQDKTHTHTLKLKS